MKNLPYANSEGTDQLAHRCSLICAFVVRYPDSIIHSLAKSKMSGVLLASLVEQACLNLTWLQTTRRTDKEGV